MTMFPLHVTFAQGFIVSCCAWSGVRVEVGRGSKGEGGGGEKGAR